MTLDNDSSQRKTDFVGSRAKAEFEQQPRLISISIPVYNEAENIMELLKRLRAVADSHVGRYRFEFLFTDDASSDSTYDILLQQAKSDHRIRVLRLSRTFGLQRNVLTNFLHARGDAAIEIDGDLQDPPELISDFLALWEKGYLVVYGVRSRRNEGVLWEVLRKLAYRFISGVSEVKIPADAGDFRLIDRVIIEHLRTLTDCNPYLRGYIASLGFPQIGVPYVRPARAAGKSKFNILKLVKLGIDGVTSQSTRPLHYITLFGFGLSLFSGLLICYYLVGWALGIGPIPRGFTSLVLLQLFAIGMNAVFLGLMGEYIGRIFDNVRGHAITIVERVIESGVETRTGPQNLASTAAIATGSLSQPSNSRQDFCADVTHGHSPSKRITG
jgi:dolichol-phosphate mannosyltransferase